MNTESQNDIAVIKEITNAFIDENMKRTEKNFTQFTNYICQGCKATIDTNSEEYPYCGNGNIAGHLAGLYTDGK